MSGARRPRVDSINSPQNNFMPRYTFSLSQNLASEFRRHFIWPDAFRRDDDISRDIAGNGLFFSVTRRCSAGQSFPISFLKIFLSYSAMFCIIAA